MHTLSVIEKECPAVKAFVVWKMIKSCASLCENIQFPLFTKQTLRKVTHIEDKTSENVNVQSTIKKNTQPIHEQDELVSKKVTLASHRQAWSEKLVIFHTKINDSLFVISNTRVSERGNGYIQLIKYNTNWVCRRFD